MRKFKEGVKLLVFPESFIPSYPAGLGFGTVVGSRTEAGREQFREFWENSVEVPGKEPIVRHRRNADCGIGSG